MSFVGQRLPKRLANIGESLTVALADQASDLRRRGQRVIDLSAGRAPEATLPTICDAAFEAMRDGHTHQTPARGTAEFLCSVANKFARENGLVISPDEHVIATQGCKQGLMLALLSVLEPGDEVLVEDPCFVSHGPEVELCGGSAVPFPLHSQTGFRWDIANLRRALTNRTRAILICNPHNPTGRVASKEDMQLLAEFALEHNLFVISDEIYERVTWGERRHISVASIECLFDRSVALMGMTKSFSMGGWRIGFAIAGESTIHAMTQAQQHLSTCASSIAQAAVVRALEPDVTLQMAELWAEWEERCHWMVAQLANVPLIRAKMPEGGFYIWLDVSNTGASSAEFCKLLTENWSVIAVPGCAFGQQGEGFVRITAVKSLDELAAGARAIQELCTSLEGTS